MKELLKGIDLPKSDRIGKDVLTKIVASIRRNLEENKTHLLYRKGTGKGLRTKVLDRDNHKCCSCRADASTAKLEVDHIICRFQGGKNTLDNLQTLCFD